MKHSGREIPEEVDYLGMTAVIASSAMRLVMDAATRVAASDSPVLITGESGTGKELVARAIHQLSPRAPRLFVDINCAALPEHLMESELFGYEKGAFSGADGMKQGLFEAAAGGTVFLDEIGELDGRMQAKLLRVLDRQPYYRLGGTRKVQADARVVAATNLDLGEAVRRGRFRQDLFHRLDVFELRVPPLRERIEDIAPLCELFLRDTECTLHADTLALLEEYAWPGNVRELRNVLSKAVMFASRKELAPEDLPAGIRGSHIADPGYSLHGLEEQTILKVLEQTGGHQQRAADLLGISRRTLIRKLKVYRAPNHHASGGFRAGPRASHGKPESGAGL